MVRCEALYMTIRQGRLKIMPLGGRLNAFFLLTKRKEKSEMLQAVKERQQHQLWGQLPCLTSVGGLFCGGCAGDKRDGCDR